MNEKAPPPAAKHGHQNLCPCIFFVFRFGFGQFWLPPPAAGSLACTQYKHNTHTTLIQPMEAVNPLLASSLDFLKQGDVERAEKEFTEAVSACCKAYGEARSIRSEPRWIQNMYILLYYHVLPAVPLYIISLSRRQ